MAIKMKASGWIGIEYDPEKDMVITRVVPGSPAEKAGLLVGDQVDHAFLLLAQFVIRRVQKVACELFPDVGH